MGLTKRAQSNRIYLQAKHFCLWQELKQPSGSSEAITVNNPKTGESITKHGYKFDEVSGRAVAIEKYDTERKYSTRYFGFKLHLLDGTQTYVLDMPYTSQLLRRFLRVAPNVDWNIPLSITIFKGKKKDGGEELGVWFRQRGETVKPYFTKEQPHGMPAAVYDDALLQWDFKAQHRWLIERLKAETIPAIEECARRAAPPVEADHGEQDEPEREEGQMPPSAPLNDYITDDDVPF